jgi:hypothetical protein
MELDRHNVKAIIDIAIFLEFSSEDIIDPDAAVQMMENIAYELQLMNDTYKKLFIQILDELSEEYTGKQKDFIRNLANNFGLV